jgi:hypothetical protein
MRLPMFLHRETESNVRFGALSDSETDPTILAPLPASPTLVAA